MILALNSVIVLSSACLGLAVLAAAGVAVAVATGVMSRSRGKGVELMADEEPDGERVCFKVLPALELQHMTADPSVQDCVEVVVVVSGAGGDAGEGYRAFSERAVQRKRPVQVYCEPQPKPQLTTSDLSTACYIRPACVPSSTLVPLFTHSRPSGSLRKPPTMAATPVLRRTASLLNTDRGKVALFTRTSRIYAESYKASQLE